MDGKGLVKGQRVDHHASFVRRIMVEKGLTTTVMSKRSHFNRKLISAFLLKPFMTTGNRKAWYYGWAKALDETPQFVEKEMDLLFAHRYFNCITCGKRTFRFQNHQRFCGNPCRVKWRKDTPKEHFKPDQHTIRFGSSYRKSPVEVTETPTRPPSVKSHFQNEVDQYLARGGTIKILKTASVEDLITIPQKDYDESNISKREDELGHEYWS